MHDVDPRVEVLPHGPAARMVERVRAISKDGIETEMRWALEDQRIADHFSAGPIVVPGIFLAEQVAQSALLLALLEKLVPSSTTFMVGQLRCDFSRPALAPCAVCAKVMLTAQVRGSIGFQGECFVESELVARIKGIALPVPTEA